MATTKPLEIPLSKAKLTKLLVGSIVFVIIGIWFVINPPQLKGPLFSNPTVVLISGIASICFSVFAVSWVYKS